MRELENREGEEKSREDGIGTGTEDKISLADFLAGPSGGVTLGRC